MIFWVEKLKINNLLFKCFPQNRIDYPNMGTRGSVVTGIMDQMLTCFSFPKCYIDDIIIFSLTLRNHNMHDLQEVFGKLKECKLKFHLCKCWFFHIQI